MFTKDLPSPDEFWREFEVKTGEKVLCRNLGKYVSGWEEFDKNKWTGLFGLVVATTGGLHFIYHPQSNWLSAAFSKKGPQGEKSIFIPKEKIFSVDYKCEKTWWKKLLGSVPQQLFIRFRDETDSEQTLLIESDYPLDEIVSLLK